MAGHNRVFLCKVSEVQRTLVLLSTFSLPTPPSLWCMHVCAGVVYMCVDVYCVHVCAGVCRCVCVAVNTCVCVPQIDVGCLPLLQ